MAIHVADFPLVGSIESILRMGAAQGLIADADLATSEAAVLAAITAKGAKLHVSLHSLVLRLKQVIPLINRITGSTTLLTGGSLANIYAAIPGEWGQGFAPSI
jgi:hypothetical protein